MAAETEVIKVQVNGVELAITNIKEARKALKDLQSQALTGNKEAAKSYADLGDRLEDLKDETQSLKGSGVEKLNSSFSLLKDGIGNFDFDKVKTGFRGIGAAMSAIPILLIVQGITYLVQNFDELSKGSGFLARALRVVGDVITFVVDKVYEFTDAIGLTNSALDELGEKAVENAEKAKEALDAQTAAYDRQISVAKAAGKSAVDLEKAKQQAIIDTNYQVAKQIEAYVRAGGELDDEQRKILSAALESIKNAKTQQQVIELDAQKQQREDYKKHLEELKKINEESAKNVQDALDRVEDARVKGIQSRNAEEARLAQERKAQAERDAAELLKAEEETTSQLLALDKRRSDEEVKNAAARETRKRELSAQALNTLQGLSNVFFANQLKAAAGNADAELRVKKKQFEVEKAFRLANVAIDTASAILKTTAQLGLPAATPFNIAAAALGAIQAGIIAAAQFDPGQTSASVSANSATGVSSPDVSVNPPQTFTQPQSTVIQRNENNRPIKVVVLQQDIRDAISEATKVELQASY